MRQALAGMLWSKQFYDYDVDRWLDEHGVDPLRARAAPTPATGSGRTWYNADVISMPDKWEYPWYAAWDLAFHVLALTLVDEDFAKGQLELMLRVRLPPPERPDAGLRVELRRRQPAGPRLGDDLHLPTRAGAARPRATSTGSSGSFHKLLLNFTWWVNRKDAAGSNLFEGGFLGLDNIGVFDRSAPLPTGGYLEQADGTAWMALFCQNMLEIALELALERPDYAEHRREVRRALPVDRDVDDARRRRRRDVGRGGRLLLRRPAAARRHGARLKVRSMVGLLPLCAVTVVRRRADPASTRRWRAGSRDFLRDRPELREFIHDPLLTGKRRPPARARSSTSASCGGCWRGCSTRTSSSAPTASARCRATTREHPYVFQRRRPGLHASPTCRPSPTAGCSAATRTGAARSGCPSTRSIIRALLQYYALLRRRLHGRVPDGLGAADDAVSRSPRSSPGAWRRSSCATRTGRRPVYGGTAQVPGRSALARPASCSTSTSTATTAPASARATRPAGPGVVARADAPVRDADAGDGARCRAGRASGPCADAGATAADREDAMADGAPRRDTRSSTSSTRASGCTERSRALGRPATLDDIPDAELDAIAAPRLRLGLAAERLADRRRRAGRSSRSDPGLRREFQATLPDLRDEDVGGSGFAITGYDGEPDSRRRRGARAAPRAAGGAAACG